LTSIIFGIYNIDQKAASEPRSSPLGDTLSLVRAKEYIKKLHSKQGNPDLWPDFLTGLPDKTASLRRINNTLPKLGPYAVAYLRITNINPFLLKYGMERHAEVVQWAAAILKTVADEHGKDNFVGAIRTHDFVVVGRVGSVEAIVKRASSLFQKRTRGMYDERDIQRGYILSFKKGKAQVRIGLMRLTSVITDGHPNLERGEFVAALQSLCSEAEDKGQPHLRLSARQYPSEKTH